MNYVKSTALIALFILLTACQRQETELQTTQNTEETAVSERIIIEEAKQEVEQEQTEEITDNLEYTDFESLSDVIWHDIESYGYSADNLSISFYDFVSGEEFHLNADYPAHGASTNKVGTAVLYTDLIQGGYLDWDSHLPLDPSWIEDGGGEITANPDQTSYSIYDLIYQSLFYSDNTAWNTLINNYYNTFGDFQEDLISLSGLIFEDYDIHNLNFATTRMLNEILIRVASYDIYQPIVDIMLTSQSDTLLKMYVDEGMAAKYGQYEDGYHDSGIYYENGAPAYTIVVMSHGLGSIDYFLGDLNLHIKEFREYQQAAV